MRSISVWHFIKTKTGGIFYFLLRCSRCRITRSLFLVPPPAAKAKAGAPLKNALNTRRILSSRHFTDVSTLSRERACSPQPQHLCEIKRTVGVACREPANVAKASEKSGLASDLWHCVPPENGILPAKRFPGLPVGPPNSPAYIGLHVLSGATIYRATPRKQQEVTIAGKSQSKGVQIAGRNPLDCRTSRM